MIFFLHWAACRSTLGTVAWIEQRGATATTATPCMPVPDSTDWGWEGGAFPRGCLRPLMSKRSYSRLSSGAHDSWLLLPDPQTLTLECDPSYYCLKTRIAWEKGRVVVSAGPMNVRQLPCSWTRSFLMLAISFLTCRHWVSTPAFRMVWGYREPGERTDPQWAVSLSSQHCVVLASLFPSSPQVSHLRSSDNHTTVQGSVRHWRPARKCY